MSILRSHDFNKTKMFNSTGIAKVMFPEFTIPLCSSIIIFFKVSLFLTNQYICVYKDRSNLLIQYQQGSVGGLI